MAWPVPLPEATGDEAADLAAFLAWEQALERHYHPDRFGPDGERLPAPREFTYYLGIPEPFWLRHPDLRYLDDVPKFVSAARFNRYVTGGNRWPTASNTLYAIDSGAYIALTGRNKNVPWFDNADVYGGKILRFIDNTGYPPDFAAIQDLPCEDAALAATGLTVRNHQDLTTDSYEFLVREFPMVPWIPVLQGKKPGDHVDHANMYADRGIDLAACHRVGVGSICRLTELDGLVARIAQLEDLAAQGLKLHGFGLKTDALPLIGHVLASADSMAWSSHVRHNGRRNPIRLPGCTHAGDCRNCYRYAVHWRERVLAAMHTRKEPTMPPADLLTEWSSVLATTARPRPARAAVPRARAEQVTDFEQGDLLGDFFTQLGLTGGRPPAGPRVIPLAEAEWGMYGEVSSGVREDGSVQVRPVRGWLTEVPRIYTGGEGGVSNPKWRGKPLLSTFLSRTGWVGGDSVLAFPDATFTLLEPPAGETLRVPMLLSRRMPAADLRRGDVFRVDDEPGLIHHGRTSTDRRARYHVQGDPVVAGEATTVQVLVGGQGTPVAKTLPTWERVGVEDPREHPWKAAGGAPAALPA